ncbi:type II toxin-antitoxin system HipA family toxin (plasmid) [Rhizobium sp. T1470]|uniref:type II toxin-antitoxin system HipA family toxin n=1 Tax=unclassified Rhizobium TaxID=2613769 RepID=UPI001AAEEDA1|nr:type II toxin-antitoxin system HipA family toxin [Rhizobium sp. T1473]MCA0805890.1 type II toxin-antitoxin system HipA family toxin [Rhizobium sp. T1473]
MISDLSELYVWIWLPMETHPVVAGRAVRSRNQFFFNYGRSYLERENAIAIFDLDLPLEAGIIEPPAGHLLAPSLRDALPDRWGRRVIVNDLLGLRRDEIDEDAFDEMTFMHHSGSDRIGALDFQESASEYTPRESDNATLVELQTFADKVEAGEPVPKGLDRVILHGSSIGGARPKALISDEQAGRRRKLIAKFSAINDTFAMVRAEFVAMRLASLAGIAVAPVEINRVLDRDVLLVERFDRLPLGQSWTKRAMVSALTWTQENELAAHHISYQMLAELIRSRFSSPLKTLEELFSRLCFNILVGNTDDHARNHAAFWDGEMLSLTPAYDIAPQRRGTPEANQAMIVGGATRAAQLTNALAVSPSFLLSQPRAREIIDNQAAAIVANWRSTCDEAGMTAIERRFFEGRQILNGYAFDGYGPAPQLPS